MHKAKLKVIDQSKSIEALENDYWVDFKFPTGLVERCFKYRKIPIRELSIEQLRMLIGQNIGVKYIFTRAYEILRKDILAEGDLYPGDLLTAVLNIKGSFFESNPEFQTQLVTLLKEKKVSIEARNQSNEHRQILRSIDHFLSKA